MSNESRPGCWRRIGIIAPIVINVLVLGLGGGFIWDNWINVPDLAYTILPTYELENQSFGGLVVENRGRATAHEVVICVTDFGSNIEKHSVKSDEIWTLEELRLYGGTDAPRITIGLGRMTAGSSTALYLLTSGPLEFHSVVVTADEGRGRPATAVSRTETATQILTSTIAFLGGIAASTAIIYSWQRSRREAEMAVVLSQSVPLPYDFIDHFAEAEKRFSLLPGSIIESHRNATCGQERMRAIFEHPPDDPNEHSTLTYNLTLPPATRPLEVRGFIGIMTELSEPEGLRPSRRSPENPVLFEIWINEKREYTHRKYASEWEEFSIRVPWQSTLRIRLSTNCLETSHYNWAVWGEPRLVEVTD